MARRGGPGTRPCARGLSTTRGGTRAVRALLWGLHANKGAGPHLDRPALPCDGRPTWLHGLQGRVARGLWSWGHIPRSSPWFPRAGRRCP
eukprot:2857992-Prymnesium_polylepis.1